MEHRSARLVILGPEPAAVRLNDRPADWQSHSDALWLGREKRRKQPLFDAITEALSRDRQLREHGSETLELRIRLGTLTPREREVFALVVTGLLNKQIAGDLGTTEFTIKVHRGRVMRKMGAGSLADLVRMAQKLNISA